MLQSSHTHEPSCRNHKQNIYKQNSILYIKWIHYHDQVELILGMHDCLTLEKSTNAIFCLNRIKGENYMIISIDAV